MKINVNGTWRDGIAWVKVGNTWRQGVAVWEKVNNVWREMAYKFTHITTSPITIQRKLENLGKTQLWYQVNRDVTCVPANYPLNHLETFAKFEYVAKDTYVRLGFTDSTERARFLALFNQGKASIDVHGPFVLTLDNNNSTGGIISGTRIEFRPINDELLYNMLRDWEGKQIYVELNIDD